MNKKCRDCCRMTTGVLCWRCAIKGVFIISTPEKLQTLVDELSDYDLIGLKQLVLAEISRRML